MEDKLFEMFCNDILDEVIKSYDYKACIKTTEKNNGRVYTGIMIRRVDECVSPIIYLDSYYKEFLNCGVSISEIAKKICDLFESIKSDETYKNAVCNDLDLSDWRDKVFMIVINRDMNKNMLNDCPHINFLDLTIVFRYMVSMTSDGIFSILLHNDTIKDCTANDFFEAAKKNTFNIFNPSCMKVSELLSTKFGVTDVGNDSLYVVNNDQYIYGSINIVNTGFLKKLSETFADGKDFYIIPSSTNELLTIFDSNIDPMFVSSAIKTIADINEYYLKKTDILSYNLYRWNSSTEEVEIV